MLIHKEAGSQRPSPEGEQLPPAPSIVGTGRCGTTLLRLMLDAHPDLAISPETHFIPHVAAARAGSPNPAVTFIKAVVGSRTWGDLHLDSQALGEAVRRLEPFTVGEALRLIYRLYAACFGKARWGDKTPIYFSQMSLIHRLLPEARFVHIIRDGRDVALSHSGLWFGPRLEEDPATWWTSAGQDDAP